MIEHDRRRAYRMARPARWTARRVHALMRAHGAAREGRWVLGMHMLSPGIFVWVEPRQIVVKVHSHGLEVVHRAPNTGGRQPVGVLCARLARLWNAEGMSPKDINPTPVQLARWEAECARWASVRGGER